MRVLRGAGLFDKLAWPLEVLTPFALDDDLHRDLLRLFQVPG